MREDEDELSRMLVRVEDELRKKQAEHDERMQDRRNARNTMIATINTPAALTEVYQLYNKGGAFTPGQIVRWKPGMCNREITGPFVVMEVTPRDKCVRCTPEVLSSATSSTSVFLEHLDVRIGFIAPEEGHEFLMYWLDSRRLEPVA